MEKEGKEKKRLIYRKLIKGEFNSPRRSKDINVRLYI